MAGLLHIYCGDGKGKTTAAVGLTVRAAGAGIPVVFAQFFKSGGSSEVKILRQIANVHTVHCQTVHGRFSKMTDAQRQQARAARDFARADALRDQLKALGYAVEDTKQGPKLRPLN